MNKLSADEIDKELKDRDDRKPIRKVVDDKVIPAGSIIVGGALGAANALMNIKTAPKLHTVD